MHLFPFLLPSLVSAAAPPAPPPATVISGCRIEVGDGKVIENGSIVLRGGRIESVVEGLASVEGATVVPGRGLTAYPGFVDAYSTAGLSLPTARENVGPEPDTTTTAPATMWAGNRKGIRSDVRAAAVLDPKATLFERAGQGVTTVLLSSGNGSIAGTAALVDVGPTPTVLVADAAEEFVFRGGGRFGGATIRDDDENEEMGGAQGAPQGNALQGNPQGGQRPNAPGAPPTATTGYAYPGTLFGVFALVRQTLYDARAYAMNRGDEKSKTDPTYEGLRPLVTGRMPALFTLNTSREIARAARLSDEFGFRMIVNGAPDAYRMIPTLKARQAPVIVSLDVPDEPRRTVGTGPDPVPQRVLEDRYAQYKERMGNARLLDAAGIQIAFRAGSEPYLVGVRKLVKASGLSREAALRAMAANPAQLFGVAGQIGTIAPGKRANLVLMTGDFLDDKATIRAAYVDGVLYSKPAEAPKSGEKSPFDNGSTPPPPAPSSPTLRSSK